MANVSQAGRLGQFHTELGANALALLRFTGTDRLNGLFSYRVEALSADPAVDFDALLGTHGRVSIASHNDGPVWFDGIVTRAIWAGTGENGHRYDLELRPWLWLAGKRRDQRIFHDKTAPQIIAEVLGRYSALGAPHFENKLSGAYPALEYTVQYRETDLAFVTRLMQRFGISYHFRQEDGSHTMVLTDMVDDLPEISRGSRAFHPVGRDHVWDDEHLWEIRPERNVATGGVRYTDYNFKRPTAAMEVERQLRAEHPWGDIEAYDYPGDYLERGLGERLMAAIGAERERGQDQRVQAVGDLATLHAGMRVTVAGNGLPAVMDAPQVCLEATYSYVSDSYGTGGQKGDDHPFTGQYLLQPTTAPLRPEKATPRALVHGPQTATVVGEGEIDCDEYGRILVRFHWDLEDAISMRCRVSQSWAGGGWGGMVIPRIGMEVVVEFIEGDPDQPLVTGCVYNGRNGAPYALPSNKTKSVFRTDTHQGAGYNELMFDDEKDEELVYLRGQKDQTIEILHDRSKTIGNDEVNGIGHDRTQSVGNNETLSVGVDKAESIEQDSRQKIGRDNFQEIGRNRLENIGKDHVEHVGNILAQTIHADYQLSVGRNVEQNVSGKVTSNVVDSITINTGEHLLMGFKKFEIRGPGGKIVIDPSGISLEAPMIRLKGMVQMGGAGAAQVPVLQGAANDAQPLVEECAKKSET